MESIANPCPGVASGVPGYLLTTLIQTILTTQCLFGNPKDYPEDFGDKLKGKEEFDFIVVGAGSAGAVIANRLSEVENWKVLLLEAGDTPTFESDIPGFAFSSHGSAMDWKYKSEPNGKSCLSMAEQRCSLTKGKALGGSSSLNLMHYARGNADDYDTWERHGNPGWKYEDVLPYFLKSEKLHKDFTLSNETDFEKDIREIWKVIKGNEKSIYEFSKMVSEDYHSANGVQSVNHFSYDFYLSTLKKIYCYAVNEVGMDCTSDVNGGNQLGFVHTLATVHEGGRANTAKMFLNPVKSRSNLFVARKAHVDKVLLEKGRAVGVKLTRNDKSLEVFAKKEVILSAGAFNSPKILMLSGLGPKAHLKSVGVEVVRDVPGLGHNLQSHVTFFGLPVSIDKDAPEVLKLIQKMDGIYEFLTRGSGLFGNIPMNDFVGFVATTEKGTLPDVQLLHFLNHLNDTYLFNEMFRAFGFTPDIHDTFASLTSKSKIMLVCPTVLKPKSRGRVELASSSPKDPPRISANFLSEDEDVATLLRGIKAAVALVNATSFETMQAELVPLSIPGCEDLEYNTKPYWECLARHLTTSLHDYAGTCRMGPESDDMAVVDPSLKLRGVAGLRVADSSVMPEIIRGSTHIAAIMIAEKVSDLIKDEWKGLTVQHQEL